MSFVWLMCSFWHIYPILQLIIQKIKFDTFRKHFNMLEKLEISINSFRSITQFSTKINKFSTVSTVVYQKCGKVIIVVLKLRHKNIFRKISLVENSEK